MLIDEIAEIVAERLQLSPIQVKAINRIQWKFLLNEMQSGKFNPVQIFYIGKFSKKLNIDERGKPIIPEYIKKKFKERKSNEQCKGDI